MPEATMFYRSMSVLPLLLLAACTGAQDWTAVLTPNGVELTPGWEEPEIEVEGEMRPALGDFSFWSDHVLFSSNTYQGNNVYLDGALLPEAATDGEVDWSVLQQPCLGEDTAWGIQRSPGSLTRVMRFDGQSWVEEAELEGAYDLHPRHGEEPVLASVDRTFIDLDGEWVGEHGEERSTDRLFAGGVLMEVHGWVDTAESGPELRQQRIVGPECEALLAGELAAYIPSSEGLETLSIQGVMLHHERVLPDCQVELIEEIYHPEKGFYPGSSIQAGDHAWAYWN
jgi:hypothetical protein